MLLSENLEMREIFIKVEKLNDDNKNLFKENKKLKQIITYKNNKIKELINEVNNGRHYIRRIR
jgi:uncharacterized protein (UPF0210 family)